MCPGINDAVRGLESEAPRTENERIHVSVGGYDREGGNFEILNLDQSGNLTLGTGFTISIASGAGANLNAYFLDDTNSVGDGKVLYSAVSTLAISEYRGGVLNSKQILYVQRYNSSGQLVRTYTNEDTIYSYGDIDGKSGLLTFASVTFDASDTFRMKTIGKAKVDRIISVGSSDYFSPNHFTATYLSSTSLTLSGLPFTPVVENFVGVIEYLDAESAMFYSPMDHEFDYSGGALAITGATFDSGSVFCVIIRGMQRGYDSTLEANNVKILDSDGNQISNFGAFGRNAEYKSPFDFTAEFLSSSTLTLSDLPESIDEDSQLVYVLIIPTAKTGSILYENGKNGITLSYAGTSLTIDGVTPFASGDQYEVGYNAQKKAYDPDIDAQQVSELSPVWDRNIAPVVLVTDADIGDTDGVYKDQGGEVDCRGFSKLTVWLEYTHQDSTGCTIQVLSLHTAAGTEHVMETVGDYIKTIGDASINIRYDFDLYNTTPFVQIQTQSPNAETGTESTVTITYTLGYA